MKPFHSFYLVPWVVLGCLFGGCAPTLQDRLAETQAYATAKPEETAAWFATNQAPLSLMTCRTMAQKRTLKLTQSELEARLAQLSSTAAFSAFLPHVEATYQRSGTNHAIKTRLASLGGLTAQMQDRWVSQAGLTISQPVFAPNAWLLWAAARHGSAYQALIAERNRQMLDIQVATLFYDAAVAAEMTAAYEAQVKASGELLQQIQRLAEEGMALRAEVLRAEAFHKRDGYNLQVAQDNAQSAKANLLDLMNFYPLSQATPPVDGDTLLTIRDLPWALTDGEGALRPVTREAALQAPLEEWLWAALVNRREMWAADRAIVLRKVEVLSALANLLPTLSVTGGGAYTSNSTTVPHRYLTGGVGGVLTLFDGLQTIAETMKAQEAKSAAFKLREDAANTLMVSVWQAWVNLRQARDRQAVAAANRLAAEVDYEETTARYQQGQETLSEVLDAYSVCEQARIDALSASYAEALAEVVFRDTVGLGWGDAVVASAPQAE